MKPKDWIRRVVERSLGVRIFGRLPRGVDVFADLRADVPEFRAEVVVDVGAHVGESARKYLEHFSEARLYCVEPVAASFAKLQERVKGNERVKCFRVALGSAAGTGKMLIRPVSSSCRLLRGEGAVESGGRTPVEEVTVMTLDGFCAAEGIVRISYLKIDTEGGDLEVLKGAGKMLGGQRIDVVEVEAGMNPGNRTHVPFEELKRELEGRRYFLFGIYEQVNEFLTGRANLRRTNPVFVAEALLARDRSHG